MFCSEIKLFDLFKYMKHSGFMFHKMFKCQPILMNDATQVTY